MGNRWRGRISYSRVHFTSKSRSRNGYAPSRYRGQFMRCSPYVRAQAGRVHPTATGSSRLRGGSREVPRRSGKSVPGEREEGVAAVLHGRQGTGQSGGRASGGVVAVDDDNVAGVGAGDLVGDRRGGEGGAAVAVDAESDRDDAQGADNFCGDVVQVRGAGPEVAGPLSGEFSEAAVVGHDLVVDLAGICGAGDPVGTLARNGQGPVGGAVVGELEERVGGQVLGEGKVGSDPSRVQEQGGGDVLLPQKGQKSEIGPIAAGSAAKISGQRHPARSGGQPGQYTGCFQSPVLRGASGERLRHVSPAQRRHRRDRAASRRFRQDGSGKGLSCGSGRPGLQVLWAGPGQGEGGCRGQQE